MGRAVEAVASSRRHVRVALFDSSRDPALRSRGLTRADLHGAEVAFEFTSPAAAEPNVLALIRAGVPVVSGTTGWNPDSPRVRRALARSGGALLHAPNFSVGMSLFGRIVGEAARLVAALGLHDPYVLEVHHRGKLDAPSGTARRLGEIVLQADSRFRALQEGNPDGRLERGKPTSRRPGGTNRDIPWASTAATCSRSRMPRGVDRAWRWGRCSRRSGSWDAPAGMTSRRSSSTS
jgi:dihydrodipicolinate reductase